MFTRIRSAHKGNCRIVVAGILLASPTSLLATPIFTPLMSVSFVAGSGFVPHPSVTGGVLDEQIGILNPSINPSQLVLAQLIFSADPMSNGLSSDPARGFVRGDDRVLMEFTVGDTGMVPPESEFADFLGGVNLLAPFEPGYIYGRIFSFVPSDAASLSGNFYYDGPVVQLQQKILLDFPQGYNLNQDALQGGIGDFLNLAAVPVSAEANTFALLMMGLTTLLHRRRAEQNSQPK